MNAPTSPNPPPYQSAHQFAESRGWRVGAAMFSIRQLRDGVRARSEKEARSRLAYFGTDHLDHADYFRQPDTLRGRVLDRATVPAGIVAHLYDRDFYAHRLWAEAYGLRAELLPHSWYHAPGVIAVLYLPPEPKEKM